MNEAEERKPPVSATPSMQGLPGPRTVIDGREYLYFAGTGYLGLQCRQEVIEAACEAARRYGIGSATSRSGFGNQPVTLDVERRAAAMFGAEDALYFPSGYVGAAMLMAIVADDVDALFVDAYSHYSVMEAGMRSGKPLFTFAHRDPHALAACLKANLKSSQRPLVLSDGVFSVLGTIAPVAEYRRVLAEYPGSVLCIDDAHAVAVLGERGRGTFEHAALWDCGVNVAPEERRDDTGPQLLMCGTLSKAVGGYGGIIPGSRRFIERVKAVTHYYEAASTPPAPVAAATAKALELIIAEPQLRQQVHRNVERLKEGLRRIGLDADDSAVPIVCLRPGDAANVQRIHKSLMDRGIAIGHIRRYSGVEAAVLRIAVFATHAPDMIDELVDALAQLA